MDIQTIQMVVGILMVLVLALPLGIHQYIRIKTKGKMLINIVDQNEEGHTELVSIEGISTKPDSKNRSYVPKGKRKATRIAEEPNPETGEPWTYDTGEPILIDGKPVYVGNTYETYYPEGMPRVFQVRLRKMDVPAGSPIGINYYGRQSDLQITDEEITVIKREAFSKAAMAASNDARELLDEVKKTYKPQKQTLLYILIFVAIAVAAAGAYFGYMNSVNIQGLKWW